MEKVRIQSVYRRREAEEGREIGTTRFGWSPLLTRRTSFRSAFFWPFRLQPPISFRPTPLFEMTFFTKTMLERYVSLRSPFFLSLGSSPGKSRAHRTLLPSASLPPSLQDAEVTAATSSPFLTAAGKHELSKEVLSEYLTQDKIYAFAGCESRRGNGGRKKEISAS